MAINQNWVRLNEQWELAGSTPEDVEKEFPGSTVALKALNEKSGYDTNEPFAAWTVSVDGTFGLMLEELEGAGRTLKWVNGKWVKVGR